MAHCVRLVSFLAAFLLLASFVIAQTAATATISGTVTDNSGAVIPGATVTLLDTATSSVRTQQTNSAGQYTFVGLPPGDYKLTVAMASFRQSVLSIKTEVAKAYTVNITMEVGEVTQSVEVSAAGVELQTFDATVGNVIQGESMLRLPNINRSALVYYSLQPLVMPTYTGLGSNNAGQVAGARSDQTSFAVDGVDATDNIVGNGGGPDKGGVIGAAVPVPSESIEEFRVATTNPNASYGRASGGQFAFVTKRGTNTIHGSAYEYLQNDNLNANTWTRNRTGIAKPELKDNRFGGSVGGPIWKDHTFIYANYEGRRFPQASDITRLVPRDSLKSGTLRFRDASGVVRDYALGTSTQCGPAGGSACDPRGLGLNPLVRAVWSKLPAGNDSSLGDGLNTIGFRAPADSTSVSDTIVTRLDHNFSAKWRFDTEVRFSDATSKSNSQVDIGGLLPGDPPGQAITTRQSLYKARSYIAALSGVLTPALTNELRAGFVRSWTWSPTITPFPQVPGTNAALSITGNSAFGGLVDVPIDVHTQRARTQGSNQKNYQLSDNVSWNKGRHLIQFGGSLRKLDLFHFRNDKVVGSITSLVDELDAQTAVTIPTANRPPDCTGAITANCLTAGDVTRWNRLFAGVTGMVDSASVLVVRDRSLANQPLGAPLLADTYGWAFEGYVGDTWKFTPRLTITAGLSYGLMVPPVDDYGRTAFMIDAATGKTLGSKEYLDRARQAGLAGQLYNPTLAWLPTDKADSKRVFNTQNTVGPRLAAAWNPSFDNGILGRVFGKGKTVFRGGWGLTYDRMNTVWSAIEPMLGPAFGQTINCRGPLRNGTCANVSDPTNAYRIGVDGPGVVPPIPTVSSPVVIGTPFAESLAYQPDPVIKTGYSHNIDFTIQRELPHGLFVELGYAGRLGRDLRQVNDIGSVPLFYKDAKSGQIFAAAYDSVANQLRSGIAPANVTPQPWFEDLIGAGGTVKLANSQAAAFRDGMLRNLWTNMVTLMPTPITNTQVQTFWMGTDNGYSNYHAFFVSVRKRAARQLTFDVNYTLSKALDLGGVVQNSPYEYSNSYDPRIDYGPAFFDRRHVLNASGVYEIPMGRGHRLSGGPVGDKILGGWYVGGIYIAHSGLPLTVMQSNQAFGGGDTFNNIISGGVPIVTPNYANEVHSGVAGSGGVASVGNPATGGSGLNLFADPAAVIGNFRRINVSQDGRAFRGILRGLPFWNLDASLGKRTPLTERVNMLFSADFLNIFNHVVFTDPALNLLDPRSFGVITSQFNTPRAIQLSLRFEF
jgi:hypothetical protein